MTNLYYQVWVDGILNSKDYKKKDPSWKTTLFIIITICNAINLYTIYLWLKFVGIVSYLVKINISSNTIINSATNFVIQFALPVMLLNYFLIFYKSRYKKLIRKYQHKKGKLAMTYTLVSVVIWFVSMIIYGQSLSNM